MVSEDFRNSEEVRISREFYAELDDEALDLLRQYYKIEDTDDDKILKFVKRNRPLPAPDINEQEK